MQSTSWTWQGAKHSSCQKVVVKELTRNTELKNEFSQHWGRNIWRFKSRAIWNLVGGLFVHTCNLDCFTCCLRKEANTDEGQSLSPDTVLAVTGAKTPSKELAFSVPSQIKTTTKNTKHQLCLSFCYLMYIWRISTDVSSPVHERKTGLHLRRSEVLRSLRHYLQAQS